MQLSPQFFLEVEEADSFHKKSPSVDCGLSQSEGIWHSKQIEQVCLPVFTANTNELKTRSHSRKHRTYSRQPPNSEKAQRVCGSPELAFLLHTSQGHSSEESLHFPQVTGIGALISEEQCEFERELCLLLGTKGEMSLKAGSDWVLFPSKD